MKQKILVTLVLIICVTNLSAQNNIRIKENFDFDWRFTLSDRPEYATVDYNDKTWDTVQLPHDWNIQQEFDICLLYTSPSPRDRTRSRMPSSA